MLSYSALQKVTAFTFRCVQLGRKDTDPIKEAINPRASTDNLLDLSHQTYPKLLPRQEATILPAAKPVVIKYVGFIQTKRNVAWILTNIEKKLEIGDRLDIVQGQGKIAPTTDRDFGIATFEYIYGFLGAYAIISLNV
ncbi:hypothetical protein Hypma_014433 [Hypsizygus marmoreus]|uniref:Uncharacterized protein n=1 Tax=Hypsizygus marmoreus TaxID=39966 RepID=A0A369JCN7_HYPMA|nr:hypothetical protein Hypma_014433 [Hypsizygus marmoreus]